MSCRWYLWSTRLMSLSHLIKSYPVFLIINHKSRVFWLKQEMDFLDVLLQHACLLTIKGTHPHPNKYILWWMQCSFARKRELVGKSKSAELTADILLIQFLTLAWRHSLKKFIELGIGSSPQLCSKTDCGGVFLSQVFRTS